MGFYPFSSGCCWVYTPCPSDLVTQNYLLLAIYYVLIKNISVESLSSLYSHCLLNIMPPHVNNYNTDIDIIEHISFYHSTWIQIIIHEVIFEIPPTCRSLLGCSNLHNTASQWSQLLVTMYFSLTCWWASEHNQSRNRLNQFTKAILDLILLRIQSRLSNGLQQSPLQRTKWR